MFETALIIPPAVNSDYVSDSFLFEFHPYNSTMACGSINITDNDTPENEEEIFIAVLTTDDSAVILSPNMSTITILDDDGKDWHPSYMFYL